MRAWTLVFFKLFKGHVVRLGYNSTLRNVGLLGTTQPIRYVFLADIVDEAALALIVVPTIKEKLATGSLVD